MNFIIYEIKTRFEDKLNYKVSLEKLRDYLKSIQIEICNSPKNFKYR